MLRGMANAPIDVLYEKGGREELAAKEKAEIAVIESFLPQQMDEAAMAAAVIDAVGGRRDRSRRWAG